MIEICTNSTVDASAFVQHAGWIEGIQSSLSDLLLYELEETPGVPLDDVQEVSSYVAALNHGLTRKARDFP